MQPSNEPIGLPETPPPPPQSSLPQKARTMAIASIVLGVVGLCVSLTFGALSMGAGEVGGIGLLCGIPLSIAGFVFGYLAMKDPAQKAIAVMGVIISCIALIFLILIAIIGLAMFEFAVINQSL